MGNLWQRIKALIIKELQIVLRNPQSRNLIIGPVLLQLAVFPFAATLEVKNASVAVLNKDNGPASVEILQRMAQSPSFTRLIMTHSEAEMADALNTQAAMLALHFPENFSRALANGEDAPLQVIVDGRRSNSGQIALGYLQVIVRDYVEEVNAKAGYPALSRLNVRHMYNPNLNYKWFILPSLIAIITTLSVLFFTSLAVAREREQGTFEQLLVTPLTPPLILFGKSIPAIIVALIQGSIIFLAAYFVYDVPFTGNLALLYIGMLTYALALVGFGFFIASLCSTQQQAFLGVFCFMMPAVVLSGYVSPVENMPVVLQYLSLANPLRHFIVLMKGIFLKSFDAALCWASIWPLLLIAVGTLAIAYGMFKRSLH